MKMLGDFVDRVGESLESSHDLARPSRIGVIATAGDRRDEDMRELGADRRPALRRGASSARTWRSAAASAATTAALVAEGVRAAMAEGARCKQVEVVLDEIEAVRHAMSRANTGDLVVVCVDKHAAVMTELENWSARRPRPAPAPTPTPPPPTPTTRLRPTRRRAARADPRPARRSRTVRSRRTAAAALRRRLGLSADAHLVSVALHPAA